MPVGIGILELLVLVVIVAANVVMLLAVVWLIRRVASRQVQRELTRRESGGAG